MSLNYPLKSDNLKKWRNATEHYKLNEQGIQEAESHIKGGWFPVGLNNFWHGGIHLDGERPVHAIEDGQIVAYRITDNLILKSDLRCRVRMSGGIFFLLNGWFFHEMITKMSFSENCSLVSNIQITKP